MAQWKSTRLKLVNLTKHDVITTEVQCLHDIDWYDNLRPDKNFQNLFLLAGDTVEQNLNLNWLGKHGTFTMLIKYRNNQEDQFRVNMDTATGLCEPGFQHLKKAHDIFFVVKPDNLLELTIKHTRQQVDNVDNLVN